MSVITYLASNYPLERRDHPVGRCFIVDTQNNTLDDGGDDRDFGIFPLGEGVWDIYSDKKYRAEIEWNCSLGRAKGVLAYIRRHLEAAEEIELWHGWLGGDSPRIIRYEAGIREFTAEDIMEIDDLPVFTEPPTHHCVVIRR